MSDHIDRAAKVIADFNACGHCEGTCGTCRGEAEALADAGLLVTPDQIAATIEQHGYVLPGGVCACGLDLNAPHGSYQKWWRAHLAAEIRQALTEGERP